MFSYEFESILEKKLNLLSKKDKILAGIFFKKIKEITSNNEITIDRYKNLKSPLNEFKRIHLTDNFILLFKVNKKENHILFADIKHWDDAYK